jgi:hypothetical protein
VLEKLLVTGSRIVFFQETVVRIFHLKLPFHQSNEDGVADLYSALEQIRNA